MKTGKVKGVMKTPKRSKGERLGWKPLGVVRQEYLSDKDLFTNIIFVSEEELTYEKTKNSPKITIP